MFTEQQIEFLAVNVVAPILTKSNEEILKASLDMTEKYAKVVSDNLVKGLKQERYINDRNMSFIKAVLFQRGLTTEECYINYCEEFDKLNKPKTV